MKKILAAGLGGGLDAVNASLIYFQAINHGSEVLLGSIRPAPQNRLSNNKKIHDSCSWVNSKTHIDYGRGVGVARYCQPKISKFIDKQILFFSRKFENKNDPHRLKNAILKAKQINDINALFFVDGGGDSLTLKKEDASGVSQNHQDPFAGGDSVSLQALDGIENSYVGVVSVGLDISESSFKINLQLLKSKDAYYGKVNFRTGQKDEYRLQKFLPISKPVLSSYFSLCQQLVALKGEDDKAKSHSAVVTYHAMKGNFGNCRTYVPWQPKEGVIVKPEHCWMYFFDASKIHKIKKQLNKN